MRFRPRPGAGSPFPGGRLSFDTTRTTVTTASADSADAAAGASAGGGGRRPAGAVAVGRRCGW